MADEVPTAGASFVDACGMYWRVHDVTSSERLAGFFLVRLAFGPTPACEAGRLVLAKREYFSLHSEKGLRLLDKDGNAGTIQGPFPAR